MSGFGNYLGAALGSGENENGGKSRIYDLSMLDNSYYPGRAALIGDDGEFVQLDMDTSQKDANPFQINSDLLGEVPGLTSDNSVYQEMQDQLHGASSLNWEAFTFVEMRAEKDSLKTDRIGELSTAWTDDGETLKTTSEDFKEDVRAAIAGKWSGESAAAAEAASQQVTKTSIYDFTSASDAIADRLTVLKDAFDSIRDRFPNDANDQLIDDGQFDKAGLDATIADFNSRYHVDGDNRLRNNDDGYVSAPDVVKEMEKINRSIADYTLAVQLFRDTYNPTATAVAQNFPNLPSPPNMKYGDATGPGGPGGPGTGPGGPGTGPGGTPPIGTPSFDKPAIDKPVFDKPGGIEPIKPPTTDLPDLTKPTTPPGLDGLTDPVKSAMDSATNAAKDAMGQAMDAAKNAAQGAQSPLGSGPQGPPEGVLGLGPQGLGGGGAGKGAGGGAPLRGLANGLPTGAPATPAAKAPIAATGAGAGAGLGSGAGAPGAGAPAAAQRGDQNGKGHQVNKALRRKKNGKDVIGDADAVVAVVGANEEDDQAEGATADQPEHRRRIPQRNAVWQPDSAIQGGPRRPSPAAHPGSVTSD